MSRFDHLREQIDACRPGSRDLALPALAELSQAIGRDEDVATEFARSQAYDQAIGAALVDVPVPPGIVDRLLAATAGAALAEVPTPAAETQSAVELTNQNRGRLSRRQLLLAGGSVALGLALCLSIYQSLRPAQVVSDQQLSSAVEDWLAMLKSSEWKPLAGGNYPPGVPRDLAVRASPQSSQALRFQSPAGWSAHVTALDIASPGRPTAVLFVVRSPARFLVPAIPTPTKGLGLSRGMKAIAWQGMNSPWLYVLAVVESDEQTLGDYVRTRDLTAHERPATGQPL